MKQNVYLIGPRASGKTTVGRMIAERCGRDFFDTDEVFVGMASMEIAAFVEQKGWDAFRDMEEQALVRAAEPGGRVVACGGGMVLREANRAVLAEGFCVYLKAGADELAARLASDPNEAQRPSLTGKSLVDEVREVLEEREPLYSGCAHLTLEGLAPDEAASAVIKALEGEG